jgi:hypothetical protein
MPSVGFKIYKKTKPTQRGVNIIGMIVTVLKTLEILRWRISKKIFAIINPKIISMVIELKAIMNVFLIAVGKMSSSNKIY